MSRNHSGSLPGPFDEHLAIENTGVQALGTWDHEEHACCRVSTVTTTPSPSCP